MRLRETETLTENHLLRLKDPHPTLCPLADPQKTDVKEIVVYAT